MSRPRNQWTSDWAFFCLVLATILGWCWLRWNGIPNDLAIILGLVAMIFTAVIMDFMAFIQERCDGSAPESDQRDD